MKEDTTQSKRKKLIDGLNSTILENALPRRSKGDMRTTIALPAEAWSRLEWFAREFSISQKRAVENAVDVVNALGDIDAIVKAIGFSTSSSNPSRSRQKVRKTIVLSSNCMNIVKSLSNGSRKYSRDDIFELAILLILEVEVAQARKRASIYVPSLEKLEDLVCKVGEIKVGAQQLPREDPFWLILLIVENQLNEACDNVRELIADARSYSDEGSLEPLKKEEQP